MALYKRIIFIGKSDTSMAPMAEEILKTTPLAAYTQIQSRGVVSLFSEPLNEKTRAVMIRNGLKASDHTSRQLSQADFRDDTLLLAMTKQQYSDIVDRFGDHENLYSLSSFVLAAEDIPDPYGGPISAYAACFDLIQAYLQELVRILTEREADYEASQGGRGGDDTEHET